MKDSFWIKQTAEPGSEALFRGQFRLESDSRVRICMVGASWYQAWIDGKWLLEGPFRYALEAPEFQTEEIDIPAGDHVLAVHARHDGVTLLAEPATEKMQFESDTNNMSKEEVKMYMGRDPDEVITPHLWRYSGNFTSKKFGEGMDSYNTVDITFGMLTDSHKYGVTGYTWSVQ